MRTLLLCIGLFAAGQMCDSQERSPTKPDGIYVSVLPIQGKAMTGDNLVDTALMVEDGTPMKQYNGIERFEETVDVNVTDLAVLAESHGGELQVVVAVIKNGRQTYWKAAQGRQVVFHYNAWAIPYFAIFPRR